jgi:hypothetical protein
MIIIQSDLLPPYAPQQAAVPVLQRLARATKTVDFDFPLPANTQIVS